MLDDSRRPTHTRALADLPAGVADRLRTPRLLIVTKASARSTVHRPDYLEYVGIKTIDEAGRVTGERHVVGLWTALSYRASATDIPFLRAKIDDVLQRSGLPTDSHDGRELLEHPGDVPPRRPLPDHAATSCSRSRTGILNLQERKQVRLFARRDPAGRFVSCLVYVPRDRYSASVVAKVEQVLLGAFGGVSAEHTTLISESVLARVHVLVSLGRDAPEDVDTADVERRLAAVSRWWIDDLRDAPRRHRG